MLRHPTGVIRRFSIDKKGNVAITFGLMLVPILGVMGSAVDFGRSIHAQRRMQTAADAAATAAAAALTVSDSERQQIAKDFFAQNNSGSFSSGPHVEVEVNGANVKVTASAEVTTGFTKLLGVEGIPIEAKSEAGQTGQNLEISMMIDLTGSMGWNGPDGVKKITGLRTAGKELMSVFFPNNAQTSGQVRVAIAPMADYVNAGPYAPTVTGLPSHGDYSRLTNLKNTKNGPFSGRYSGSLGNNPAAQAAAGAQAGVTGSGTTYSNEHCANPTITTTTATTASIVQRNGKNVGVKVNRDDNASASITGLLYVANNAASSEKYYPIDKVEDGSLDYDGDTRGYYAPYVGVVTGLTMVTRTSYGKTGIVGVKVDREDTSTAQMRALGFRHAKDDGAQGYWQIEKVKSNGQIEWDWDDNDWYQPLYESLTGTGATVVTETAECTSANDQVGSPLVTCVTDRLNADYTDDAPGTGSYIGPYNQSASGSTNKVNYSEDGKCYTAGRELPEIIPLTNDRSKLDNFFDTATIGGSTPGHLGHAWAWYMLSPKWNSIFPQPSHAAEYDDKAVMKAAIIMTDGEYNTHYASETSRNQALALCEGMRAKGIKVYTVGFGFGSGPSAARTLLEECVDVSNNPDNAYYFPQTADELKQAFKNIGAKLTGGAQHLVVMK